MRKSTPVLTALLTVIAFLPVSYNASWATETPAPAPSVSATASSQLEPTNGTYALGATGPGGGLIFFISKKGFNCGPNFSKTGSPTGGLCYYLEVAPSGWKSGKIGDRDPELFWAVKSKLRSDVIGIANEFAPFPVVKVPSAGIGLGYKNSIAIVRQGNDITTAAGASRAYQGGAKTDWYLPSVAEANELCKWARGVPSKSETTLCAGGKLNSPKYGAELAGFFYGYSTSSEHIDRNVLKKYQYQNIWTVEMQDATAHEVTAGCKCNKTFVRPIRSF